MKMLKGGLGHVLSAYIAWGLLPLYWKQLSSVSSQEVLFQRVCWTVLFLGVLLAARGELFLAIKELFKAGKLFTVLICALLTSLNWSTYLWATSHGQILQAGMGYFISPMLVAALGIFCLGERLSPEKIAALTLVLAGIGYKIFLLGEVPLVALALAGSFAPYIILRKLKGGDPIRSLFQELLMALPIICAVLSVSGFRLNPLQHATLDWGLLLLIGPVTAIPMLMLTHGLRSVNMQSVALAQFLTPSLTLICGLLAGETLSIQDATTLGLIWCGILLHCRAALSKGRILLEASGSRQTEDGLGYSKATVVRR